MTKDDLLDVIGTLDEKYLKEAEARAKNTQSCVEEEEIIMTTNQKTEKFPRYTGVAIAASLALIAGTGVFLFNRGNNGLTSPSGSNSGSTPSVTQVTGTAAETGTNTIPMNERKVKIQDMTGWDYDTAKQILIELGLNIDTKREYSDDVAEGKVTRQDPSGENELSAGDTVKLYVSLGKGLIGFETPQEAVQAFWDVLKLKNYDNANKISNVGTYIRMKAEETGESKSDFAKEFWGIFDNIESNAKMRAVLWDDSDQPTAEEVKSRLDSIREELETSMNGAKADNDQAALQRIEELSAIAEKITDYQYFDIEIQSDNGEPYKKTMPVVCMDGKWSVDCFMIDSKLESFNYTPKQQRAYLVAKSINIAVNAALVDMDSEDKDVKQFAGKTLTWKGSDFKNMEKVADTADLEQILKYKTSLYFSDIQYTEDIKVELDNVFVKSVTVTAYGRTGSYPIETQVSTTESAYTIPVATETTTTVTTEKIEASLVGGYHPYVEGEPYQSAELFTDDKYFYYNNGYTRCLLSDLKNNSEIQAERVDALDGKNIVGFNGTTLYVSDEDGNIFEVSQKDGKTLSKICTVPKEKWETGDEEIPSISPVYKIGKKYLIFTAFYDYIKIYYYDPQTKKFDTLMDDGEFYDEDTDTTVSESNMFEFETSSFCIDWQNNQLVLFSFRPNGIPGYQPKESENQECSVYYYDLSKYETRASEKKLVESCGQGVFFAVRDKWKICSGTIYFAYDGVFYQMDQQDKEFRTAQYDCISNDYDSHYSMDGDDLYLINSNGELVRLNLKSGKHEVLLQNFRNCECIDMIDGKLYLYLGYAEKDNLLIYDVKAEDAAIAAGKSIANDADFLKYLAVDERNPVMRARK